MRQLSETFSAQHVRQASQDAQSEDGPSRSARARARAQESRSRKSREAFERLFNQRLQSAHADIERGEDAEGHNKEDQMDLKGEID